MARVRVVEAISRCGLCRLGVLLVGLLGLFVVVGSAQALMGQQQTITQTGGTGLDYFGRSVALSSDGNTAIVGAYLDDVGGASNQGSATIFITSVVPDAPTSVSATSGANGQSVVVWTAPTSDGGLPITGYTVTASPGGQTCSWTSGSLSCTVTGLTNGVSYSFTVTATNAAGTSSASSASSAAIPAATVPGAPTGVLASSGADAQSVVVWTAPTSDGGSSITGYTVTASPGGRTCSWTSGSLSCTVTGLTNGVSYSFTVTATNAVGTSAASAPSSGVTPTAPATAAPATTAPATPVNVKWTKPSTTTPLVATFTAATGTTYLITATLIKAAQTLRAATAKGSCKIKSGKARCSVNLKTQGSWRVAITPVRRGVEGVPIVKRFTVYATPPRPSGSPDAVTG